MSEDKKNILKRPHEEEEGALVSPFTSSSIKKSKGFGVPNWKNIKKDSTTAIRRYKDYEALRIYNKCRDLIRDREKKLFSIPLYTISVNVLCKNKNDGSFIPLEIGMYCYKLNKGREGNPYHVLINPGDLPVGHRSLATDHAQYHKIMFPPKDKSYPVTARCDYKEIYKEMLNYTKEGERTVLISHIRDMNQIVKSLEWLWQKAADDGFKLPKVSTWTIIPIKEYILALYYWVHMDMLKHLEPPFCLSYYINTLNEADKYRDDDTIRCHYHQQDGNETEWCAQSCAIRMINNFEKLIDEIGVMYRHAIQPQPQQLAIQGPPPEQATREALTNETSSTNCDQIDNGKEKHLPVMN